MTSTGTKRNLLSNRCCVPYCGSKRSKNEAEGISFFEIPCDPKTREFFLAFVDQRPVKNGGELYDKSLVCSLHFTPSCFMRQKNGARRLIAGSIPTLLPHCPPRYKSKVNRQYLNIKRKMFEANKGRQAFDKAKQKQGVAITFKKPGRTSFQHAVVDNIIMAPEEVEEKLEMFSESEEDEPLVDEETTEPAHGLEDLCRLCSEPCVSHCVNLFSPRVPLNLADMANLCLPIQVSTTDVLPLNICPPCEEKLEKSYQFALQCQNSEKMLVQMYREQTSLLHLPALDDTTTEPTSQLTATPSTQVTIEKETPAVTEMIPSEVPGFKCKYCFGVFHDEKICEKHMKVAHREKVREELIQKIGEEMEEIRRKAEQESRIKPPIVVQTYIKPWVPPGNYKRKENIEKKKKVEKTKTEAYQCEICGKIFPYKYTILKHMSRHYPEKNAVCHICGMSFVASCDLNSHMRTHSQTKVYCDVCKHGFKQKRILLAHFFEYHLEQYRYICNECNDFFKTKREAMTHIKQHRENGTFTKYFLHLCPVCKKNCRTRYQKQKHLRRKHSNVKNLRVPSPFVHKCKICLTMRCFKSGDSLRRHMERRHPNGPPSPRTIRCYRPSLLPYKYECQLCPSKFKFNANFLKHLKSKHNAN